MNVLFVCSKNQWRSPTAEKIFAEDYGIRTRSAGTSSSARHRINQRDLAWADIIMVMEERHIEDHPEKRFHGEFDRIYSGVRDMLLRDGPRRLNITQVGWPDAVIWNPGPRKCAALADMPDEDWQRMLCVEAARIAVPVRLAPGDVWSATQRMTAG